MNPQSHTPDFSLNEILYSRELSRADALAWFLSIVSIASAKQLYRFELIRQKVVFGKEFKRRNLEKLVRKLLPGLEQRQTADGQRIAFSPEAYYPTLTLPDGVETGPIFISARDTKIPARAAEAIYFQSWRYWNSPLGATQKVYCTSAETMAYPTIAFVDHAEYAISCAAITDYFLDLFEANSPASIERVKTFVRVPIKFNLKGGELTHPYYGEAVVGRTEKRTHICFPIANWFLDRQNHDGEKVNVRRFLERIHEDFARQGLDYELYAPGQCSLNGLEKIKKERL